MSERNEKYRALLAYAISLVAIGVAKTFDELAIWLNQQGFRTSYDTLYQGGRGVATGTRRI